jgi:hypothetical protein
VALSKRLLGESESCHQSIDLQRFVVMVDRDGVAVGVTCEQVTLRICGIEMAGV